MIRYTEAIDILFENTPAELVTERHITPDFYEFHASYGDDTHVYRIDKNNGKIVEVIKCQLKKSL